MDPGRLFPRRTAARPPAVPAPAACAPREEIPTPEPVADLEDAWAELTAAAGESAVMTFHACTRSGRPWTEDPAAVRAVAAALRDLPELRRPKGT